MMSFISDAYDVQGGRKRRAMTNMLKQLAPQRVPLSTASFVTNWPCQEWYVRALYIKSGHLPIMSGMLGAFQFWGMLYIGALAE
jgi:hypothetical protein